MTSHISTKCRIGILCLVGLVTSCSTDRDIKTDNAKVVQTGKGNAENDKALRAYTDANYQEGKNNPVKPRDQDLQPDIEPLPKPTVIPPGNKAPRPVDWEISIETAAISQSGKYVVFGYQRGQGFNVCFRVWNLETGTLFAALKGHQKEEFFPAFCSFLADDQRVITISQQGQAIIHRLVTKDKRTIAETISTYWVHDLGVYQVALSENGRYLITLGLDAGFDQYLTKIWDLQKPSVICVLDDQISSDRMASVAISPDGGFALTHGVRTPDAARKQGEIYLWDIKEKKILKKFPGNSTRPALLAFAGDGKEFVLGQRRGVQPDDHGGAPEFTLWDLKSLNPIKIGQDTSKEVGVDNLRCLPGTKNWFGNAWCLNEADPPPVVGFWDSRSDAPTKVIRLDNQRMRDGPRPSRVYLGATTISPSGKYALVASGGNGCAQEFRQTDNGDRSGGLLHLRQTGAAMRVHIWNLPAGDLHRTWTDPTPGSDAAAYSAK